MAAIWLDTDNRDLLEVENYQTARIEALKNRIHELENRNESVNWLLQHNAAFRTAIEKRIADLRKDLLK
jgi:hypothetical protein